MITSVHHGPPALPLRLVLPILVLLGAATACGSGANTGGSAVAAQGAQPSTEQPAQAQEQGDCSLEVRVTGSTAGWELRRSLPCPGPEGLGVLAVGDIGHAGDRLRQSVEAMRARCAEEPCHLLAIAGDLIYGPGDDAEEVWSAVWDQELARLGLPGITVLGNHEYRHEPRPELKRKAVYASDRRAGMVLPGPAYVARIRQGEQTLYAVAAIDSDSIANPGPDMPGGAQETLAAACALGAPVLALGHHPATSQGRHHSHEAHVEANLRKLLTDATASGCAVVASLAGHDHDLQAYGPQCEEAGMPAVVVSGVAARGFRPPGPQHLPKCTASDAAARYHAGPSESGGYAMLRLRGADSGAISLYEVPLGAPERLLSTVDW